MSQEMLNGWWHLESGFKKCVSLNWAKTLRQVYLLIEELDMEHYSSRAANSWPDLRWFVREEAGGPELFNKGLKEPREE